MIILPLKAPCGFLVEGFPLRGKIDHPPAAFSCSLYCCIQTGFQGLRHHHAAETAAVRVVIHLILAVLGIITDLNTVDIQDAFFTGTPQNALMQHGVHMLREQRQDVYFHAYIPSITRTVTTPASASDDSTKAGTAGIRCSYPSVSVTT